MGNPLRLTAFASSPERGSFLHARKLCAKAGKFAVVPPQSRLAPCQLPQGDAFGTATKFAAMPGAGSPSPSSLRDATLPLLSLCDIFPRPGEVFPQRERPWQYGKVSGFAKGSPFGGAGALAPERASPLCAVVQPCGSTQKLPQGDALGTAAKFPFTAKAVPLGKVDCREAARRKG